ncbi:MAG: hypothetical protein GIKADHBN_01249 [Phycisphaerales bacterium]|nr:hypothetical protein [Phycisphaerales bacterium]
MTRIPRYNPLLSWNVGVILTIISILTLGTLHSWPLWQRLTPGVITVTWFVVKFRGSRLERFADRMEETDGRACLKCLYDLNELGDSGVCPECGEPFSAEKLNDAREMMQAALTTRLRGDESGD